MTDFWTTVNDALAWQTVHARAWACIERIAPPGDDVDPATAIEYLEAVAFLLDTAKGYCKALERLLSMQR